jgi:hypothetical protein
VDVVEVVYKGVQEVATPVVHPRVGLVVLVHVVEADALGPVKADVRVIAVMYNVVEIAWEVVLGVVIMLVVCVLMHVRLHVV